MQINQNILSIWLKQLLVATLYLSFGLIFQLTFSSNGIVSIIWPGSGLALAALLVGGRRYLWGIFIGSLLLNALLDDSLWAVGGITLANVLEPLFGAWLLTRHDRSILFLRTLPDYLRLIVLGGAVASVAGAIIGSLSLLLANFITSADYFKNVFQWWMGDALGVVLVTPVVLAWLQTKSAQLTSKQRLERLLLLGMTFVAGQIVFLGWFNESLSDTPKAHVLFLFIAWVAIRLDIRWVTLVVLMIAIQALSGAYHGIGAFGQDIAKANLENYWLYMLILSGVGMSLSTYVTGVKQRESSLHEGEARLKEVQHISQLGSWELNLMTEELVWSDEVFMLFEIDRNQLVPTYGRIINAIHPQDREAVNSAYASSLTTRKPYELTHRLLMSDGRIKWVTERCTTYFNDEGAPIRSVGTVQDITEYKLKEDQLRIAATAFETHEAIMITDIDANIITVNRAFEKITGYSPEEVIGKNIRILKSWHHDSLFYAAMWQEILKIGTWSGEIWDRHKNGNVYPMHMTISAVKNDKGETSQYVCIFSDISAAKNAEAALRKTESHFVTILNSLDEVIWSARAPDFQLYHISAATEKLYGVSQQAFMDDPELWFKMIHPDDKQRVQEATNQIFKAGKTKIEYRIFRSDGQERWLSDRMHVVFGPSGEPNELVGIAYDVTDRKLAEHAQRENQERLLDMLETSPIAVRIATVGHGRVLFSNQRYAQLINSEPEQVAGKNPMQYYANAQDYEDILYQLNQGVPVTDKLVELSIPGGGTTWAIASYILMEYEKNAAVLGWFYDVTDLREAQEALQLSERMAKQSLEELKYQKFALDKHAIVAVTDVQGRITYANKKFCEISGYSHEELIGQDHAILNSGYHPKGFFKKMYQTVCNGEVWHDEVCNRAKDGHFYWVDTTIAPYMGNDGKPQSYISIRTDISQRMAAEEKSNYLALYDSLTSLPNRRLLLDRLSQALASSARSGKDGALLFIDLDHFKTLNDTLGHDIGDMLLQQAAERLTASVREGDSVSRLGGDEYVVMLEGLSEQDIEAAAQAEAIGDKILIALNQPYQLDSHEHHSTASIGITLFNDHKSEIEELLKQADIAMYQAKKSGRNALRFFDPQMQESIHTRVDLERELRKALDKQQFHLYYQLQVNSSGHPLGAEALIRWIHPERGLVSPFHFIPLAEETGLILPIGKWVLETACAQIKEWQENEGTRRLTLSINVSAKQFHQADFVAQVQAAVQRHGINPMLLKLELTESMLLDNVDDTIATMGALKEVGIRFSLDDFGTGYSSLQYLKRLPLYQLKIDQSFVRDIAVDSSDQAIVRTIIAMAHTLNLNVIAEGVETEDQQSLLLNNGCLHYQGYLFGKPVPITQFDAALKTR